MFWILRSTCWMQNVALSGNILACDGISSSLWKTINNAWGGAVVKASADIVIFFNMWLI